MEGYCGGFTDVKRDLGKDGIDIRLDAYNTHCPSATSEKHYNSINKTPTLLFAHPPLGNFSDIRQIVSTQSTLRGIFPCSECHVSRYAQTAQKEDQAQE